MIIKEMFKKPIDRNIQGVIIVGQGEETNVAQELEEYVVTKELQKHFAEFFEAYKKGINGYTDEVGVWIQGFFGSGKSHFLKILSYLLNNKEVNGKNALDYFIDDDKITDQMVIADMKLAANTPCDAVLFNIDSKSDSNGKENKDSIVKVFLKVFNEMRGFCGALPRIAELEDKLTKKGKFDDFKAAFLDSYGEEWEESRHEFDFIQDDVVEALTSIGFMSEPAARNWCEKATDDYMISPEDFAKMVKSYIDKKGNNHHVVFLVDEVGQYIGEDSKLMLNLQTIREELSKECKGKAWVVVTSQQDIDSITHVKGNDFSKIQGRFSTRLSLSSAHVDEVIKKRILEKDKSATKELSKLYNKKTTIIKNLIMFNDSVEKKLYADDKDFVAVYPFIPYQFNLVASVLASIRGHGASGKHLSEGERSMLALFKESACDIKERNTGEIIPFHMFYNALDSFLDHSHRGVIIKAYENSIINPDKADDVFAINVLKVLFMIKYVNIIDATVENITSLMVDNIDNDRIVLKQKVEESLKVLQSQALIDEVHGNYVFLTDEEQEINREINQFEPEIASVINKVSEMIFESIFTEKRYKYPKFNGRYTFAYNQSIDDRPYKSNQNFDIGLRILTPLYDGGKDESTLRMKSGQGNEVLVVLPEDTAFLEEMKRFLKIENFLRNKANEKVAKYETIKEAKRIEMRERLKNAEIFLTDSLKDATIYVNGDIANIASKEVVPRINDAIGRLVTTVYFKLEYIDTVSVMGEENIKKMFKSSNQLSLDLDGGKSANQDAIDDVLKAVVGVASIHNRISMKSIKDRFTKAPYGYIDEDIQWMVAKLFKNGDISFIYNGVSITLQNKDVNTIVNYIVKRQYAESLMMEVRKKVSDKDKKNVREVMKELFVTSSVVDDEDKQMANFIKYSDDMYHEMDKLEYNYNNYRYPGKSVITTGKTLLRSVKQYTSCQEFFEYISKKKDDFLDLAEDYEPIKTFFEGEQCQIFKRALDMLAKYEDSKTYIVDDELEAVVKEMTDIVKMPSPFRKIPALETLREEFMDAYDKVFEKEIKPVLSQIEDEKNSVIEELETKEYVDEKKAYYLSLFFEIEKDAKSCDNISKLRSNVDKAKALRIRLIKQMDILDTEIAKKKLEEQAKKDKPSSNTKVAEGDNGYNSEDVVVDVPQVKTSAVLPIRNVTKTSSWKLESESDIQKHLEELRKELMAQLDKADVVRIEF